MLLAAPVVAMAQEKRLPEDRIVIEYENDAHCTLSGYPKMMGIQSRLAVESGNLILVSGGDFSADFMSRSTLGAKSQGAAIIQIMNEIRYDFIVPGNHDFDFSLQKMQDNFKLFDGKVVCCNLKDIKTGQTLFPAYSIREVAGVNIAFVGVTTPKAISSRNQSLFSDENGNLLCTFCEDNLIDVVQQAVDSARIEGADYVIVLSHLGDKQNGSLTSVDMISKTNGIDVVLDAHAHSVIPSQEVENKDGKNVLLSSTGLKFANIGLLFIESSGSISTRLFPTDQIESDEQIQSFIEALQSQYE